jgi:hypothetical protein
VAQLLPIPRRGVGYLILIQSLGSQRMVESTPKSQPCGAASLLRFKVHGGAAKARVRNRAAFHGTAAFSFSIRASRASSQSGSI